MSQMYHAPVRWSACQRARPSVATAASLEVAAFCGDNSERLLGEKWSTVDLRLTPESYARLPQEPLTFRVEVPVTSIPRFIKVVAYDYAADKIGSTTATLR